MKRETVRKSVFATTAEVSEKNNPMEKTEVVTHRSIGSTDVALARCVISQSPLSPLAANHN
jgi:hypothetical protein